MTQPGAGDPSEPIRCDGLLAQGRHRLATASIAIEPREALLLLTHATSLGEAHLLAHPELEIGSAARDRYRALVERRAGGEPAAYLIGSREFYGRRFAVDRRVLIPRPETEHLVEAVLDLGLRPGARIVDVGTGSGCIAATLALELPGSRVVGTDLSADALLVARDNTRRHAAPVQLLQADGLQGIEVGAVDVVVSNPPYVGEGERDTISSEILEHEPALALFAGPSGLEAIRDLIAAARQLRAGSRLVLELGAGQLESAVARAADCLRAERVIRDYGGIDRVLVLRRI